MNGLLNGLVESWKPDVTLKMVGQKTGLNTGTDAGLTFVDQAGFPGGKALQNTTGARIILSTPASALLEAIGNTDFLSLFWAWVSTDGNKVAQPQIGENGNNGVDWGTQTDGLVPVGVYSEIPAADGSYPSVNSLPDTPFSNGVANMIATWYTVADNTLHVSCNAGTVYSVVNTAGIADPDPLNQMVYYIPNGTGRTQLGENYLWQGTADEIANVVSQLASLYADKLEFTDFDAGSPPAVTHIKIRITATVDADISISTGVA